METGLRIDGVDVGDVVQTENVAYGSGEARVFIPASDGSFIKAVIGVATPEE